MTESAKLKKCSQKSLFKNFSFNNSGTREIQDFHKHSNSNKEIHVTLQSGNTKHKPFQFIPLSNFIKGSQNLSPSIGDKV